MKTARIVSLLALFALAVPLWPADRKAPAAPRNLRVTGTTAYSVSLAWEPAKSVAGAVTYRVVLKYWGFEASAGSQTTFTWRSNLGSDEGYVFYVYAVDAAGNRSGNSEIVVAQTKKDTSPPARPILEVTSVGPTYVSLVWSASDDDPNLSYWLYRDGTAILENRQQTSANVALLKPEATYNFTVRARDDGVNYSPLSDPKPATTTATNPNDVTPPTVPANFWAGNWGDCEVELNWDDSTDDFDPQWVIAYEVYVNGRFDHATAQLITRTIVYGDLHGVNDFAVMAVDSAGNRSAPAETSDVLSGCFP
jgi:chitodextrinase